MKNRIVGREAISIGSQLGSSSLFFAAVFLPVLFFVFSIAIDLGQYYRETQRVQKIIDDAVRQGVKFLPYAKLASATTQSFALHYGRDIGQLSVRVGTRFLPARESYDFVSLESHKSLQLSFARLLGIKAELPVSSFASARMNPVDALILMDVGGYLAPSIESENPWGSDSEYPAAKYFLNDYRLRGASLGPQQAKVYTEQCFNPALLPLKLAVVGVLDYLSAFRSNSVGLGFFPAGAQGLELARDVLPLPIDISQPEASLSRNSHTQIIDNDCLLAAHRESLADKYSVPQMNSAYGAVKEVRVPETYPPDFELPQEYLSSLRARDVVWSKAIRSRELPNISRIFAELNTRLLGAKQITDRFGLQTSQTKLGIVFLGDLPYEFGQKYPGTTARDAVSAGVAQLANTTKLNQHSLHLFIVVLAHPGNQTSQYLDELNSFKNQIEELSAGSGLSQDKFSVSTLSFSDPEQLLTGALEAVIASGRKSVLSR